MRCRSTHHVGCDCHEARRDAELAEMKRQRDALLEALRFYADPGIYVLFSEVDEGIYHEGASYQDQGERARAAIKARESSK